MAVFLLQIVESHDPYRVARLPGGGAVAASVSRPVILND